ncbi:MAG TPA: helix-turn-helix domain-containing protein [Thermodesulfobacteriota bacterium]|nr:helix-turn-helix domain-containing protein [Thermodesulfobacteriota bacterium]
MEKKFLSFNEVMEFLGMSRQTVYNHLAAGMPSYLVGKRRLFDRDELVEWVKSHKGDKPKRETQKKGA